MASQLTIAERHPLAGDVVATYYAPFCERKERVVLGGFVRCVQVVAFIHDAETSRCGLHYRTLPEDEDLRPCGSSWHTSGRPWLENGWYVSRADGGPVIVSEAQA